MKDIKKNNLIIKNIIKWFLVSILMYILMIASICNEIKPFGFALLFTLVWCNQNIFISSFVYIFISLLVCYSIDAVIITSTTVFVLLFFYWLHYKLKKPLNIFLVCLYAFISQLYKIYISSTSLLFFSNSIIEFFIGLIFLVSCLMFFQGIIVKQNNQNLTQEQLICGAVVLAVVSLGLSTFSIYQIEFVKIWAVFLIFMFSFDNKPIKSIIIAMSIGLGVCLHSLSVNYFVLFSCYALFSSIFVNYNKYLSLISVFIIDLFLSLFLNSSFWGWQSILAIIFGFILYMILNKYYNNKIKTIFVQNVERASLKNIVNRNREGLRRELLEVAQIFGDMDKVFRSMARGNLPIQESKQMLVQELSQVVCKDCLNRSKCLRLSTKETLEIFSVLIGIALEKGKITLIDIPNALSQKCTKLNIIINTVNNMIVQYKQYCNLQNNMDASKLLIGEQLGGVAKIMFNMAQKIGESVDFDIKREHLIIEELNYIGVECNEVVAFKSKDEEISTCLLVINNEHLLVEKIGKILSKILKQNMSVVSIEESKIKNYSNVYLKTTPKYDLIFGSAQCPKAGTSQSGDTHSYIRLGDDKIMFAISDGMGSGDKAFKSSATAISLIENFYKAGFDNETIISSVNKLLTLSSSEVFSAIDIIVVDLRLGLIDIIKIGAPQGFIKHKFETEVLDSGSLPLGILEELKPNISIHSIEHGDNIIIMSDGIIDSFKNGDSLQYFVNNIKAINPQIIADEILSQAIENDKQSPNDDMTVVVGRIIRRL